MIKYLIENPSVAEVLDFFYMRKYNVKLIVNNR